MARIRRHGRWAGHGQGVGSFRYTTATDNWTWSDATYAIHGFRRGEVVPTTDLLLAHAHPGDRRQAFKLISTCLRDAELFSFLYRLTDASGKLHWVLLTAEGTIGREQTVTGLRGYLTDLTETQARVRSQEVAATLRKAVASRAIIEQAKGALMLVYGLDADAAFALLSWQSQRENVKLRDLAKRLVAVVAGDSVTSVALRQRLDKVVYSLSAAPPPAPPGSAAATSGADLVAAKRQTRGGAVVLSLRGEIDMATGRRLDQYLADAADAAVPPAPVVVDLSRVRHLGSVGVALLLSYHRRCHAAGVPLRVASGDGPAAEVLAIAPGGLDVYRRVPDALAAPAARDWPTAESPHRGEHPDGS